MSSINCPDCSWIATCNRCQELEKQTRLLEDQKREIEKTRKLAEETRRTLKEQAARSLKHSYMEKVEKELEQPTGEQRYYKPSYRQSSESIQPVIDKIFREIEILHGQIGNIYKELEELKRLYKKLSIKEATLEIAPFFKDKGTSIGT